MLLGLYLRIVFFYSNHFNGFKYNLDLSVVIQTSLYSLIPGKRLKLEIQKYKAIFSYTENSRPV